MKLVGYVNNNNKRCCCCCCCYYYNSITSIIYKSCPLSSLLLPTHRSARHAQLSRKEVFRRHRRLETQTNNNKILEYNTILKSCCLAVYYYWYLLLLLFVCYHLINYLIRWRPVAETIIKCCCLLHGFVFTRDSIV